MVETQYYYIAFIYNDGISFDSFQSDDEFVRLPRKRIWLRGLLPIISGSISCESQHVFIYIILLVDKQFPILD